MANAEGKNIALFSDGTGNTGTGWSGSNVWKTFNMVERRDHETNPSLARQIAIYDQGVGTSKLKVSKMLGNAFGYGLSQNIRDLYFELCKCWAPGDKIFIFGFSRGAFTARSLAGMISDIGVIEGTKVKNSADLETLVKDAYKVYRSNSWVSRRAGLAQKVEKAGGRLLETDIHFVGVWDSVDAIGVPVDELRDVIYWIARRFLRAHNMHLTDKMKNVYQALAIDDDRKSFSPDVYKEPAPEEKERKGIKVEQVWFAGAHSNVGGGYPRHGLSHVALDWMLAKAEGCELRFDAEEREDVCREMDVHSTLYDSRSGPAAYYRYGPRNIGELCRKAGELKLPGNEKPVPQPLPKIHFTALDRVELATADYAPITLPADFEVVGTRGGDWERREIERFNKAIQKSTPLRRVKGAEGWDLIGRRRWLYRTFLLVTLLVAVLAFLLVVNPQGTVETWRDIFVLNKLWVRFWDGVAQGTPGWVSTLGSWIGKGLQAVAPSAAEKVVTGFLKLPEAIVAIVLVGLGLLGLQKRVLGKMRHLGRDLWRTVFSG